MIFKDTSLSLHITTESKTPSTMQFLSALLSLAVWMHFATAFIPSLHSKVSLPGDSLSSYKNLTTMRKMGLFDGIMKAFENEEVCIVVFFHMALV